MNKKIIFLLAIFTVFTMFAFAQDFDDTEVFEYEYTENAVSPGGSNIHILSAAAGFEMNMNSREGLGGAIALAADYQLPISGLRLAAGLNITGSTNFSGTLVMEITAMARWYFLSAEHDGPFAQVDLGLHLITEKKDNRIENFALFESGLRAGFRLPIGDSFYIEPYGRFGYPYFFGIGVLAGMRFQLGGPKPSNNQNDNGQNGNGNNNYYDSYTGTEE